MKMTIQFKCGTTFMFDPFTTESCTSYVLAIVIVFILSILYEYILSIRCSKICELTEHQQNYQMIDSSGQNLVNSNPNYTVNSLNTRVILTLLYTIIVLMSYLLMFILMTYNFGVIMAVILGNAVGYLIFFNIKPKRLSDKVEKCAA